MAKSEDAGVKFLPNSKLTRIVSKKNNKQFILQGKYSSSYVIGADGANSVVRTIFNLGNPKRYSFIPMTESDTFMLWNYILKSFTWVWMDICIK